MRGSSVMQTKSEIQSNLNIRQKHTNSRPNHDLQTSAAYSLSMHLSRMCGNLVCETYGVSLLAAAPPPARPARDPQLPPGPRQAPQAL